ncbi:hypothetical protein LOTGIDRAFT_157689 [Lottia gigantea]|uniref:EF-hand domain-containing protein n=1 Tax=Lottia gigantea TaxID=225164 RepID=V4B2D6_LOTGI|nr:hypothetical protein LOTGIDRAFT_157689 [Lottia gigantea]ESP00482.1 hypothetical protein LOTGIDRAFT_157689 [Lottia gigantea]
MKLALVLVAVVLVVNVEGFWWRRRRIRIPPFRIQLRMPCGKKDVRQADNDAAFKAAAEDGVLSDDEIKSVLGVADEDLADFYDLYDVNGDEKITVEEYESVTTVLANAGDKEN